MDTARVKALLDFENREGLFPAVHSAMKFSILALGQNTAAAQFAFFLSDPPHRRDSRRRFTLAAREIALINPNTHTTPIFRSRVDADLTRKIYERVPISIEERKKTTGNPWQIEFATMFHMSNDSALFRTNRQLKEVGAKRDGIAWLVPERGASVRDVEPGRYLPLYEAKMSDFYDHRAASYEERGDDRGYRVLPVTSNEQHQDANFEPVPFYFVPEREVYERLRSIGWNHRWLLGFKNVTSPTNERTFICSLVPCWGVGNSMPLIFPGKGSSNELPACLIANFSSLVFDYFCRQKVGGVNLNFFYVQQFPVFPPGAYLLADLQFIVSRVLELTYTSHSMRSFAEDLGYSGPPFPWKEERRALLRAELDAKIAKMYCLERDQLRYILDPEDVMGKGYPSETFRVLKKNDIAKYGEYRTARLVLDAWDQMER
jgi:hypothetical protein